MKDTNDNLNDTSSLKKEIEFITSIFPGAKMKRIMILLRANDNKPHPVLDTLSLQPGRKAKVEAYYKFFPSDNKIDWDKYKSAMSEGKLGNLKFNFEAFKKAKREMVYKLVFPKDKTFDWEKFRETKRQKIFSLMFPGEKSFDPVKFKEAKKIIKMKKMKKWAKKMEGLKAQQQSQEVPQTPEGRRAKYFAMFPEDKEVNWEKFRAAKQAQKLAEKNRKLAENEKKRAKYFKIFPEDKEVDWEKFKAFKKGNKSESSSDQSGNEKLEKKNKKLAENEKKREKYFALFPEDKEVNWEKFKEAKKAQKIKKFEENEKKREKYFSMFPNDKEIDWEKFKAAKKARKAEEKKIEKEAKIEAKEAKKAKKAEKMENEKRRKKYFELFPNDTEINWEKFKIAKRELKFKEMFPNETHFNLEKFQKAKRELKYKEMFPNDSSFDWKKFKAEKLKKQGDKKEDKEEKEIKIKNFKDCLVNKLDDKVKTVYINGNILKKFEPNSSEQSISELSFLYTSGLGLETTLIFNNNYTVFEKESDGVKFRVCLAKPNFETSDDALVEWAGGLSASDLENTLFVTGGKPTFEKLAAKGAVKMMRPKIWWENMKDLIGLNMYEEIVKKN